MGTFETRYVEVGGAEVAYRVMGDQPPDIVWCNALGAQVDLTMEVSRFRVFFEQLGAAGRVVLFDRRGAGASDPLPGGAFPTWEELAEDLLAVLDDIGSERAAIAATVETGPVAILVAAMHPERVSHLMLFQTTARYMVDDDYPAGVSEEAMEALIEIIGQYWGTDEFSRLLFPSQVDDAEFFGWFSRMMRASATRRAAVAQYGYFMRNMDVRPFLAQVQAPTLVVHSTQQAVLPIEQGRYLADHILGARLLELPSADFFLSDELVEQFGPDMVEFMTGDRPMDVDRVLATILFTDIVKSTEQVSSMGDHRWRLLLDSHDRTIREQIHRFKGKEVNTTGDGFLISFDAPARAIRCARAIGEATALLGIEQRAGLHTGECEVRGDDLGGVAVHIAARVGSLAASGEVLVSGTVRDLVIGSGIEFDDRGEHALKGVPGSWRLFAVRG